MYEIVICSPDLMSRILRKQAMFRSNTIAALGLQEWLSKANVGSNVIPSGSKVAETKVIELIINYGRSVNNRCGQTLQTSCLIPRMPSSLRGLPALATVI